MTEEITSDVVYAQIKAIAETPGKNDKVAMLKDGLQSALFEKVMVAAHDPYVTYGIKKRPASTGWGDAHFSDDTWLLLDGLSLREYTGNTAIEKIQQHMASLTKDSAELLWNIITKDLKAGFGDSSLNKAKRGLIKTFPYMRCSLVKDAKLDTWPFEEGVISQEKADGMFANVDNEKSGVVNISSRQGSLFPSDKFGDVVFEMQKYMATGYQYHGEFLIEVDGEVAPREIGNGIMNSVLKGGDFAENEKPVYMIWDRIPLENVEPKGKYTKSYKSRLQAIFTNLKEVPAQSINLIETRVVRSLSEAYAHYATKLAQGKEGTIIKHPKAIWKDGKSKELIKLKLEVDVDLKVTAIVPGKIGSRIEGRAGALSCTTSCGNLVVDVTVKNEAMRDHVDANPDEWLDSIIPVKSNQITLPSKSNEKHSLFLPRMVEATYRTDKSEADSLEEVIDQFDSAIKGESSAA